MSVRCGFCGHRFDPAEAARACGGCPLRGTCGALRCPRCGYEMPPPAMLVGWLRRLRERLGGVPSRRRGGVR